MYICIIYVCTYIIIYISKRISSINHGSIEKIENLLRVDSMLEPTFGASEQPANHPGWKAEEHISGAPNIQYIYIHVSVHVYKHYHSWVELLFLGSEKKKAGNLSSSTKKGLLPNLIEPWTAELGPVPLLGVTMFSSSPRVRSRMCPFAKV